MSDAPASRNRELLAAHLEEALDSLHDVVRVVRQLGGGCTTEQQRVMRYARAVLAQHGRPVP